jgi:hypothetical protein
MSFFTLPGDNGLRPNFFLAIFTMSSPALRPVD